MTEQRTLRSCLSSLDAVEGPRAPDFAAQRAFERSNAVFWFGFFQGGNWYLPYDIDRRRITAVASDLTPPPQDTGPLRRALYEMWLSTKHERMSTEDRDALLMLFVERLSAHPQHVVAAVLSDLSATSVFFPAWAEIEARIAEIGGWRERFRFALRRTLTMLTKEQT